jgi:hypothetical protein
MSISNALGESFFKKKEGLTGFTPISTHVKMVSNIVIPL